MTKTIRVNVTIDATAAEIYPAFADANQVIRWLAEEAQVDLDAGQFALWGPSIPGLPSGNDGHMQLVAAEPDKRLEFEWQLLDDATTATIELTEDGGETQVSFEHAGIADNDWAWTVASFWAIQAENLRGWVERGITGPRFDFRELVPGDIEVSAEIDAPASEVFRAITDPEMVGKWMMSNNVTIEPEVGGTYDLEGWTQDGPVKIVDLQENEKLAYSWRSDWVGHETLVTWELAESQGKTRLTLMHSGFASDARHDSYRTGWLGFLVAIKALIERAEWAPPQFEIVDAVAV